MLHIVFSSMLIVLNAIMLALVLFFVKGNSTVQKAGTTIMGGIYTANILALIGGIIL